MHLVVIRFQIVTFSGSLSASILGCANEIGVGIKFNRAWRHATDDLYKSTQALI